MSKILFFKEISPKFSIIENTNFFIETFKKYSFFKKLFKYTPFMKFSKIFFFGNA